MKVNIEVDCTPDEARRFLGLPDVAPMQQTVMAAMEKQLVDTIQATDSQKLLDQWLPLGMKGIEQWQSLWTNLAQTAAGLPALGPHQAQGIAPGLAADTIYAPATAPGRAPVGVLRVSGPQAAAVAAALTGKAPPKPRMATLRWLRDPVTAEPIDQALLLWFPAPRSETGEDLLEIQHHGGAAVLGMLLAALEHVPGCRPAGPGEFTRRAFLNGKLDLTAAEGLADLIDAEHARAGPPGLASARWRAGPALSRAGAKGCLGALARIEAEIDFAAEEEVPEAMVAQVLPGLERLRKEMAAHLADAGRGERLRAGVVVAVIGAPNVGKSSLVNLLARREVAIVTAIAGTTRDVIEVQLDLGGVPVTLLDTAGLRETADPIEAEGVARARRRAGEADLRLHVDRRPRPRRAGRERRDDPGRQQDRCGARCRASRRGGAASRA